VEGPLKHKPHRMNTSGRLIVCSNIAPEAPIGSPFPHPMGTGLLFQFPRVGSSPYFHPSPSSPTSSSRLKLPGLIAERLSFPQLTLVFGLGIGI
jgi:hypothetical protein